MKRNKHIAVFTRKKNWLPLFSLLVLGRAAKAQENSQSQIIQAPVAPVESTSAGTLTNEFQVFPLTQPPPPPSVYEPFRWGKFVMRPHASYQYISAHGVLAHPGDPENTTIQQISPGVLFNLGDHWALDETMTLGYYSNKHFKNEFDNAVILSGQTVYNDWIFGFLQTADMSSSPLVETGTQTDEENYQTEVSGEHEVSEKVTMDLAVDQNISFASGGYNDSREWSTLDWLNYDFSPGLNVGIGGGLGYVNVDYGSDQTYEQLEGRLNWRATHKISFQIHGGLEEREFLDASSGGNLFNPVYGGSVQYQPFQATGFYFAASRTVSQSLYRGMVTETTSLSGGVSQQLLQQFYLGLNVGYSHVKFVSAGNDILANRTDNNYYFGASLSHSFLKRGSVSVFFQYGKQKSTAAGFTYLSHQFGARVSYAF